VTQPTQKVATAGEDTLCGRPARPERPAGYWERIDRIVSQAPPLTAEQRIKIRAIFQQSRQRMEKAA
jgi:hypothetical protein